MTVFGHQSVVNFNLVVGYFCAPTPLVCTQCLVEFNCRHFFFSYKYSPHFIRKKSLKCVNRVRKDEWNISTALFCSLSGTSHRNNYQNLVNQPMMCCCKYLDNQTSCPSRQALSDRGRPSDAEVCGGGEASTPTQMLPTCGFLPGTDCMCTWWLSQWILCSQKSTLIHTQEHKAVSHLLYWSRSKLHSKFHLVQNHTSLTQINYATKTE